MRIPQGAGVRGGLSGPVLAALLLAGCGGSGRRNAPAEAPPQRVVCASPAVAEIVYALGCGDRVAGVSEFTDWPADAARKPSIGGALALFPVVGFPAFLPRRSRDCCTLRWARSALYRRR